MIKQVISAILLCLATACASLGSSQTQGDRTSYIEVDNGGWSDVTVYAVIGTSTARTIIGHVGSFTKSRLTLFTSLMDRPIFLVVHPLAGPQDWASDEIQVRPDQYVDLHIETHLPNTYYSIWTRK